MQRRLALMMEAREYAEKMSRGSVFVTDFKAMALIRELTEAFQDLISENLKLEADLKSEKTFKKSRKESPK